MGKYLEAFKNVKEEAGTPYFSSLYDIDDWRKDLQTLEKGVKALEIILSKISPLARFTFLPMTQEEFKIIDEVINDERR